MATEPFIPIALDVLLPNGKMHPTWWKFFLDTAVGLTTVDLATQTTGILPAGSGGTGINNNGKSLTLGGAFALTLTQTANTNVTLPTSGTLISSTRLQAGRVTTGAIGPGASALVTLTWGVAFADANYTVNASVVDATAAVTSLQVVHIETVLAASVAVRVQNTAAGALTGTLNAIGMHD
jgi:hypothetical protein